MIFNDVWNVTFVLTFTPLRHIWAEYAGHSWKRLLHTTGSGPVGVVPAWCGRFLRSTPISIPLTRMRTDVPRPPESIQALPLRCRLCVLFLCGYPRFWVRVYAPPGQGLSGPPDGFLVATAVDGKHTNGFNCSTEELSFLLTV